MTKKIDSSATDKALFKNTGIIAIGQISTRVVNFFLLPLYTALLNKEEYGLIDLLTTYSGLIAIVVGLQMHQAVFRFLVTQRDDENRIKNTISTIIISTLLLFGVYTVLFGLAYHFIKLDFKWFLLIHVMSSTTLNILSGIARGLGRNADYAIGNFISSAIILVLNVLMIAVFKMGVPGMLFSFIVGPFLGSLFIFFRCNTFHYIDFHFVAKANLHDILNYSVPLIPNELSWSVIHSSDRWIISAILGLSANGLLAVASKFSLVYSSLFSVFNTSWTEQVVLHYRDEGGAEYVNDMFNKMVTLFASFAIGIVVCMPFLFKYMVNEEFAESYNLIPLYMIAVFFNAIIGLISAIYLVENETKQVAISTSVAAAINVLVDFLTIKSIGVFAAPVSSICGYATISLWRLFDVNKRHCKISLSNKNLFVLLCMFTIGLSAYYSNAVFFKVAALTVVAGLSFYVNSALIGLFINYFHGMVRSSH